MPEKQYTARCGGGNQKSCPRCWRNKLKHGNKLKKRQFPKQNEWYTGDAVKVTYDDDSVDEDDVWRESNQRLSEFYDAHVVVDVVGDKPTLMKRKPAQEYNALYENYAEWLSAEKRELPASRTQFIRLLRQKLVYEYGDPRDVRVRSDY